MTNATRSDWKYILCTLTLWTLIPGFPGQPKNGYNPESRNTGTSASNTSLIQLSSLSIQ
jgi:hypothetical protein